MSDPLTTIHLDLPYIAAAQAQKHVTHNEALRRLDSVVQLAVLDSTVAAPPGSPAEGDRYIVAAGATGAWTGHEGEVAAFVDGAWELAVPEAGWIAFDAAADAVLLYTPGGAWEAIADHIGAFSELGVNATADATNRLAVRSAVVLLRGIEAADGGTGDIRVVVDKEAAGDTASLVFQSGASGRAEIGLAGDTDLVVKVSPDGASWTEAIRIDKDTGLSTLLYDNGVSGLTAATVQDAIDEIAATGGGGAVASVFGRTGAVIAVAGDYAASAVTFTPAGNIAATTAQAAIEEVAREFRGFKNVLHNGGFQIAQRGDGPFTAASAIFNNDDTYLLDGCIFLANGSDTCDVSRVADTDFVSGWKMRLDVETANRRFGVLFPVEKAAFQEIRFAGNASIQFKAKRTGTSLANVRAYLLSWSGTADAITSDVISAWGSAGGDPTFVANWTAENAAANIAVGTGAALNKIENIAVDTASVANLALLIISDPTTTTVGDFLDIGDVQIEVGAVATAYEHRPKTADLQLCQCYYEASLSGVGNGFSGQTTSGSSYIAWAQFKVTKRTVPSLTLTHVNASGFPAAAGSGSITADAFTEARTANSTAANSFFTSSWIASAEL